MEGYKIGVDLWVPGRGMDLSHEYPTPNQAELTELWQSYAPEAKLVEAPGLFGVIREPEALPEVVVSVDVCEVLRQSHASLRNVEDVTNSPIEGNVFNYRQSLFSRDDRDVMSIIRVLMNNNLVMPVEDIDKIASVMQTWRSQGVYVVANTSTLPGCEPGTIDFFNTYLPDCFDGLLLPRNHDGTLPLTKGVAIKNLIEKFRADFGHGPKLAMHIDDAPHHQHGFIREHETATDYTVATFAPYYKLDVEHPAMTSIGETPYETFRIAHQFIRNNQRGDA